MATLRIPVPLSSSRALPSEGTHLAGLFSVVFLGTQSTTWAGETKPRQQLRLGFELADEFLDDGRPLIANRTYTYSWAPRAALRLDIEGWLGRFDTADFDLAALTGRAAIIGISHGDGQNGAYAFVSSILPVPARQPKRMKLVNKPVVITPLEFDLEVLNSQPEWLREKIRGAAEYRSVLKGGPPPDRLIAQLQRQLMADSDDAPAAVGADIDDEIPF